MPVGIYISVPFCRSKCSYCNFASGVFAREMVQGYVERVCAEIARAHTTASDVGAVLDRQADSIYFGGGTPTTLAPAQLQKMFAALRDQFNVDPAAEVTVECAPGSLTPEVLGAFAQCGVNRVSLGVQSFVDQESASVGRRHTRATVFDDIGRLRALGISNINIDLIAGLPHQTSASWQVSLDEIISAGVPHASVYMLEVDQDSRLGRELIAGGTRYHAHFVPDEDATTDFYLQACSRLNSAGIEQYEISNFARPGMQSKHNLKYWTRQPYMGFGLDAHSMLEASQDPYDLVRSDVGQARKEGGSPPCAVAGLDVEAIRFSAPDSLDSFISGAPLERTPVCTRAALEETLFLGLRLNRGVNLKQVSADFALDAAAMFGETIRQLQSMGLLQGQGDVIALTSSGRLLSNEVFQRFISVPASRT